MARIIVRHFHVLVTQAKTDVALFHDKIGDQNILSANTVVHATTNLCGLGLQWITFELQYMRAEYTSGACLYLVLVYHVCVKSYHRLNDEIIEIMLSYLHSE